MLGRRTTALVAVLLVTLAGNVSLPKSAAAWEFPRRASCEYRACLALLPDTVDKDGDGVSDVDELSFGTQPDDPTSYPSPHVLIDSVLEHKLVSFERHLTELVVLPQRTPEGDAIATGLGEFQLQDRDSKLFLVFGDVLRALEINGFDSVEGSTISLPEPLTAEHGQTLVGPLAEMALVSSSTTGGTCCLTNYGTNAGKSGTTTGGGTATDGSHVPEFQFSPTGTVRTYTVTYSDGSHDDVESASTSDSGGTTQWFSVKSHDAEGKVTSETLGEKNSTVEDDGTRVTTMTVTTKTYDKGGNQTGTTVETTRQVDSGGKVTTETKKTQLDGNGKVVAEDTETTETCSASKLGCTEGEKYSDPDYVAPGPLTADDMERVKIRLNAVRKPGPDSGEIFYTPTSSENPLRPDSWVVLINPDGVTEFAVSETPRWNILQPDYDPWLLMLSVAGGAPTPQSDGDTVHYP